VNDSFVESQKARDTLAAFFPRKISRLITAVMVKTPITANQTTWLWGGINVLNAYFVYLATCGRLWLVPVVFAVWVLTFTLDCVDGEVARYRKAANPVGGKLLDGICHRATEYALLAAFGMAAWTLSGSIYVLPVALLLVAGDAMQSYAYERRMLALRVHKGYTGTVKKEEDGLYVRGARWRDLTPKQRLGTLTGQLQYRSIYVVILLGNISGNVLLAGLVAVALLKHYKWMALVAKTLRQVGSAAESTGVAA
jgi:phosphatidylglycerophosphate synthase